MSCSAPSTTWAFVRSRPRESNNTPLPWPRCTRGRDGAPLGTTPKKLRNRGLSLIPSGNPDKLELCIVRDVSKVTTAGPLRFTADATNDVRGKTARALTGGGGRSSGSTDIPLANAPPTNADVTKERVRSGTPTIPD